MLLFSSLTLLPPLACLAGLVSTTFPALERLSAQSSALGTEALQKGAHSRLWMLENSLLLLLALAHVHGMIFRDFFLHALGLLFFVRRARESSHLR